MHSRESFVVSSSHHACIFVAQVIGKGSFGKVMLVRKKDDGAVYAMKVLRKDAIIKRRQVAHTQAERDILTKMKHHFIVNLNFAFQTKDK